MIWIQRRPGFEFAMLGIIPSFLDDNDERSAREQIEAKYIGGWHPTPKFKLDENGTLTYPGDPPLTVLCETYLRGEIIYYYQYSWLAIVQPDGSFEVSRLD